LINRVILIGRLTADPELRVTTTGKNVCNFRLAVQKRTKPHDGSPEADYFNVIAWEKTAEYISNYITKGRLVAVDGRLQSRRYTTADGSNREVVEIIAEQVQALDRPREDAGSNETKEAQPAAVGASKVDIAPNIDEYDPFADE
jgi:single-strand DNA-binding protein